METSSKVKVLIVDDEKDLLDIIERRFASFGFEIFKAESGNAAWKLVNEKEPHIVITDVRMKDGTGIELLEKIKNKDLISPAVFIISGYSDFSLEQVYHFGADGLFSKPFDANVLKDSIRKALLSKENCWSLKVDKSPSVLIEKRFSDFSTAEKANLLGIGRGGFFFPQKSGFPRPGDICRFDFRVESNVPSYNVSGVGEVRWVRQRPQNDRPAGFGLEIRYLDDDTRHAYSQWLARQKLRAYIPRDCTSD